jgi:hypothetical protein
MEYDIIKSERKDCEREREKVAGLNFEPMV